MGDRTASVDEHADLTADLPGELRQLAGELVRDEPVCRQAPGSESFELLDMAGPQAVRVAEGADRDTPGVRVGALRRGGVGRRASGRSI
jgi:hypothetical protein